MKYDVWLCETKGIRTWKCTPAQSGDTLKPSNALEKVGVGIYAANTKQAVYDVSRQCRAAQKEVKNELRII